MESLIFILIISVLGGANTLQCYRCINCPTVTNNDIVTCGNTTTSTTPSTTQNSTEIDTTTTPETTFTDTTTAQDTITDTAMTTTASFTTTNSEIESSNNTSNSTAQNDTAASPETVRVRRSADDLCLCKNGICDCNGLRIVQYSELRAGETYVCVKDEIQVNGTTVINRGCAVKKNATTETCVNSAFSTTCTVCETDKCNDATSITFSFLVIFTSLIFVFKLY